MEWLDPVLDKVCEWARVYLEILADTNTDAMRIVDAHDKFCREVIEDEGVNCFFENIGWITRMLSARDLILVESYSHLAQCRMWLIAMPDPHHHRREVIFLVSMVRTLTEVLSRSQIPQMKRMVVE